MEGKKKKIKLFLRISLQVVEKENFAKVTDPGFQKTINTPRGKSDLFGYVGMISLQSVCEIF